MTNRRSFDLLAAGLALSSSAFVGIARVEYKTFRIAFQKGAGNLVFLKERGILERKREPLSWSVTWTAFREGPQLMESLNIGVADFGRVGESPPIFAQATDADIMYAAYHAGA